MPKMRVHELAKLLDKSSKEIIAELKQQGVEVQSHMSTVSDEHVDKLKAKFQKKESGNNRGNNESRSNDNRGSRNDNRGDRNNNRNDNRGDGRNNNRNNDNRNGRNENRGDGRNNNRNDNRGGRNNRNDNRNDNRGGGRNNNRNNDNRGGRNDNRGGKNNRRNNRNNDFGGSRKQKNNKKQQAPVQPPKQEEPKEDVIRNITLPDPVSLKDLADACKVQPSVIIKKLFMAGQMVTINTEFSFDDAAEIALEYNCIAEEEVKVDVIEELLKEEEEDERNLTSRPPVVCVMGHVDHGKTSLLDAIRNTNVTAGESGGITQHIGASEVTINGKKIVFLDTPGHEAFTTMRARGAQITDIAVLVVAADDSVKPQTIESISHAKAANVPIIVAINKMDKPGANPDKVKKDLADNGILVEDWGGDVISVPVSAKKGEGITDLLEMILLEAEMLELKANPDRLALGTVIEARLDKARGPIATLLVMNGTLKTGQSVVAGTCSGKIRVMTNFKGDKIRKAGPATAVEILGLSDVPMAGDAFNAVKDDKVAREIANSRAEKMREDVLAKNASMTLDKLFSQIQEGETKELNLIIKADVQGSVGAIISSLEKLDTPDVRINVVHSGVGTVTESDVMLAETSNAIIIGFNVRPTTAVTNQAADADVEIRTYRVIYDIIDEISDAMKGMLDPEFREEILGKAEIRDTFRVPNVGTVGGAYVTEGKIQRNAQIRLVRDGIVIHEGTISSLKRYKDDAKEVATGYECGLGIENYNDIKPGDTLECFTMVEVER